ncbi:RICIN domain-containing protein [Kineosporia sp. NBRC 101731]|uniref:ricin-type beta-trefoil lectin domain protein n=1 Tax=Kineosporia sp. NBRC 101731 TaxID=3032199 RepID=UPI0024A57097|nr:RICIN domain-containing protein [Kineosporia sp. NBRC 101731]GLY30483.1 glucosylceramidase [Kineosporia sp. NBRC 101731]
MSSAASWRRRNRRSLFAGSITTVAAVVTGYLVTMSLSSSAAEVNANVWLTTPDRTNLLARQAAVPFGTAGSGPVITVDPETTYQSMVGFGASFTDSAAYNVFTSTARDTVMKKLFDPDSGIGLSFLRQPLGASDYSRSFYTYDDGKGFSIAHDQDYILPLLKQAKTLNPEITYMGTPWSAPASMKTPAQLVGGTLSASSVGAYADYLVKTAKAYQAAGVPLSYLSVQNEPEFQPPGYPGMKIPASLEASVINALAPRLAAAGLTTKILGYDHNWNDPVYPEAVLAATGANVAGTAFHCYEGDPTGQSTVHDAAPQKDIFFTECSGTESADTSKTFGDSLWWQGRNLAIGATRNWARTVATWNIALDADHGPQIGSCQNCTGVVTVDGGKFSYNAEYYVLGHLSKFVKPCAVRIASTAQKQGGIENVAFRNPDGTVALVAVNTGGAQNFQVSYRGKLFGYRLPAGSMATFTWPGGTPATTPTPSATASTTASTGTAGTRITGLGGKCLDVADSSTADGATPQMWDCFGAANQQWTHPADGTVRALGKCLDVTDNGTANGTAVQLWDCYGSGNQQWTYSEHNLVNKASGKCLDVRDGSTTNGATLQIWTCTGAGHQKWAGL